MNALTLNIFSNAWLWIEDHWRAWLGVIFWLAAIFFLGRGLIALVCRGVKFVIERRRAKATEEQKKRLNTAYTLLTSIARYVIYFCMLAAMLGVLGLGNAMNTLLASVGIGGLAIGIGAQTLINDIVTGFFLLFEDQLSVGDYIKVGQACGIVEEISLRTTSIRGFQGELFVIPNGQVTMLTSYSRGDYTVYIDVPVERGADVEKAKAIMAAQLSEYEKEREGLIRQPNVVGAVSVSANSLILRATVQTGSLRQWEVQRALIARFEAAFHKAGIGFPRPVLPEV